MTENELADETASPKMMGFGEAIKTCFKKYFSFQGCATRAEYWWFFLFVMAGQAVLLVPMKLVSRVYFRVHTMGALELMVAFACLALLFNVAVMLPLLSVGIRRMHDTGNAGFLLFIPVANLVISLLPSEQTSEYRSGYNIHPVRNAIGMVILVFILVSYVRYMGGLLSSAVLLSLDSVWNYTPSRDGSDSESLEDDEGYWLYDDDNEDDNSETIRSVVEQFFEAGGQKHIELVDEENGDLYFWGETDLFIYPTLENGLLFEHYAFEGDFSSLDDFSLDGEIDFRFFEDSPYTALRSGKSIMFRKESGNYSKFTFTETLSAE